MGHARVLILSAAALIAALSGAAGPSGPVPALAAPANDNFNFAPANDNFANAVTIVTPARSGIVATGLTVGATTEAGEPTALPACQRFNPSAAMGATAWFNWTSPGTAGTIVFSTWGSDFDTFLGIHTGGAVNGLTTVACQNDFWNVVQDTRTSLALNYAANTTYRIQLGGASSAGNNFVLSIIKGAELFVTHGGDNTNVDGAMSLREAMLLARGGTTAAGLNRSPDAGETFATSNVAAAGAANSDVVHFYGFSFPAGGAGTVALGSGLPDLNATNDTVSGSGDGVLVDGVTTTLTCFAISGSSNVIEGVRVRRCSDGIQVTGANNVVGGSVTPLQRAVIGGNSTGVRILGSGATGNLVTGNYVGTSNGGSADPNGNGVFIGSASGNTVGGSGPGQGNVISGNSYGIILTDSGTTLNIIRGNIIGLDPSGNLPIPNNVGVLDQDAGLNAIGGSGAGEGNTISGNTSNGIDIVLFSDGTSVYGNKIGTDITGTYSRPNGGYGIGIGQGRNNIIGGVAPGQGNLIANNRTGVIVSGGYSTGNSVRGNSIHDNTVRGIQNELNGNLELPPPVIGSVAGGTVSGFACANCTVDIYNDIGNQGRLYLGSTIATGGGTFAKTGVAHALGNVTAISMDSGGNTSGFSAAFAAAPNADGDGLPDGQDGCPFTPEDYDGFQDGDGCPDSDNDVDGICDQGQAALGCTGSDTGKTCFDPAGTLPCATFDCRNIAEDWDNFKDGDGCPEPDNDNDGFTDGVDQCPGVDWQTGPDGMFGAPQDQNHNGIKDPTEALFTTDDVLLAFEDRDGVLDTDGCHDSPGEDFDGDGFTDDVEAQKIGTNPGYPCGNPGWPADLLADNRLNVGDINSFLFPLRGNGSFNKFDHPVPDPNDASIARWNLQVDGTINIGDLNALNPAVLAPTARPPMFGGQPAFFANAGNGVGGCPLPP